MRRELRALTFVAWIVAVAAAVGVDRHAGAAAHDAAPAASAVSAVPAAPDAAGKAERAGATLAIFNRPIVRFRQTFLGVRPDERADAARARIVAALERGGKGEVTVEPAPQGAVIKVDGTLAFILTHGDSGLEAGEQFDLYVGDVARRLRHAIGETRELRDGRLMLEAGVWAGAATAIYVVLLWGLVWLGRLLERRVVRLADEAAARLRVGGGTVLDRSSTSRAVHVVLRFTGWGLALLLTYEWLGLVLGRFPFTRPWGEQLNAFLIDTAADFLIAIAEAAPELLVVVLIFVIARWITGAVGYLFDGVQSGRIHVGWLDADTVRPTRRLANVLVWLFAVAMAYPYIPGSGTEAFKGLSVLVGLMLSIGASGTVGQAASGLILMYTRTFRPGEYVRVGENEGTIVALGMFTTRLRTGMGEELTLPNSLVLASVTRNYSRTVKGAGFIVDAAVTIGYDAPWRQVHAMLIEAASRTEGVLADPPPHVFQIALSDFYVEYRLVCQAIPSEPRPRAVVLSALHQNIQDVFNEHGVQIMSPHYLGDPADAKIVPQAKWYAPPAAPPG